MNRENLFAYTPATGRGYPPYVSINRHENGDVEVTVRAAPTINEDCYGYDVFEGKTVSVIVPASDWKDYCGPSASGIEARQRTDPEEGLDPKGESPTGKAGDAQGPSA